MAITRVAAASDAGSFGNPTFTVSDPGYASDGDFSLAMYWAWGNGATLDAPWVQIIDEDFWPQNFGGHARQQMWWRPDGVGSVTFEDTDNLGSQARGVLLTYAGADTSGPADFGSWNEEFPSTPDVDAPSVTAAADGSVLITGHCALNNGISGSRTWTAPSGMTMVDENNGTPPLLFHIAEELPVAAGATGVRTATLNDLTQMWALCAMSVVLSPAPDVPRGWRLGLTFAA